MREETEVCIVVWQVVIGLHFLAHHVAEFGKLVAGSTLQDTGIVAMSSRFLEIDCGLNVVLILCVRVQYVASFLCVRVRAPALSINTSYT
jgi:hypothetical protein